MSRNLLETIDQRTRLAGHNRLALLLFRLGGSQLFGVNVFKVQEVVRCPQLTWMPGSHPLIRGIADVRGRSVPVLHLAKAISHPQLDASPDHLVVTEFNRSVQGFLVDSVDRIVNISVEDVRSPPRLAGEDSYLTAVTRHNDKLVQIIDVEKVLAEVVGSPSQLNPEVLSRAAAVGERQARILVVDDSRVARSQIQRVLEQLGIETVMCCDGREALRHLQSLVEQGVDVGSHYAMLISDIEMPDMDGYTLTTEIRRDPQLSKLYVLLHTSLSGVFNQAMIEQVGANKFCAKYSADELAGSVINRLESLQPKAQESDTARAA